VYCPEFVKNIAIELPVGFEVKPPGPVIVQLYVEYEVVVAFKVNKFSGHLSTSGEEKEASNCPKEN
jgi:hypothetical protein